VTIEHRPDPESLLARLKEQEARERRGKLKVFFGAAAGVGKTYAMLEAAREQRADGVDVLVGCVETHGRAETEALLDGLPILPPRVVAYRGTTLREFDLDAALARRPALILVDELAHTNAPGSRHAKRWQDVQELLDAGIDVYTTVNVQHVESLNDVVAQITGIVVRETVPDSVFEQADELELIDLPPDDLLERFREGKVYVPEQAQEAVRNFFRKGNLIALRELALRRTAERVDAQMRVYMREHAIGKVWPVTERLLVCVGPSPTSIRLVRAAKRMAERLGAGPSFR
jgi:two-component system, OmpR family, sensor histidine kinase KdpD